MATPLQFSREPMEIDGSPQFLAIRLPSRDHPYYREAVDLLKQSGFLLEPSNRRWWLRDRHKTLSFLSEYKEELDVRFGARFTDNFRKNFQSVSFAEVAIETAKTNDGFTLDLRMDAPGISAAELQRQADAGRPFAETPGGIVVFPQRKWRQIQGARQTLTGSNQSVDAKYGSIHISHAEIVPAIELFETLLPGYEPPATWRERSEALRNLSRLQQAPLPETLDGQLRLYQKIGVAWLFHLYRNRLAGILADEMGLGKTLQALCLIVAARGGASSAERKPSLVVCPASLTENWKREAARFVPDLQTLVHHGTGRMRNVEAFSEYDLVITSYGTLQRDAGLFREVHFDCAIGDEAQHIKNRRTANARALTSLRANGRFLLTGTPVENSLADLISLFSFLMPGYLKPIPSEAQGDSRTWHEKRLQQRAAPYILRRTKQQVAPELPPKIEKTFYCAMGAEQRALYDSVREKARHLLLGSGAAATVDGKWKLAALTQLLRLRQICCDPRLLERNWTGDSAKLRAFREITEEAMDDGHRMLVFSQFVSVLQILKDDLKARDIPCAYLDGQTRNRLAVCDEFNNNPSIPVFLISLKAGGAGLNLTGADTVLHFDPWWNPAAEAQATDRAHRIGQTRSVTSIKLIASVSVEEKVLALQERKRALLAGVFEESDAAALTLDPDDVEELLR